MSRSLWGRWTDRRAARRALQRRHAEAVRVALEFVGQTHDPAAIRHGVVHLEAPEGFVVRVVLDNSTRAVPAKPLPKWDVLVTEGGTARQLSAEEGKRLGVGPWR